MKLANFYSKQFPALFDRSIIENIDTRAKTLKLPSIGISPSDSVINPQKQAMLSHQAVTNTNSLPNYTFMSPRNDGFKLGQGMVENSTQRSV
jgi:hypothetical protein